MAEFFPLYRRPLELHSSKVTAGGAVTAADECIPQGHRDCSKGPQRERSSLRSGILSIHVHFAFIFIFTEKSNFILFIG